MPLKGQQYGDVGMIQTNATNALKVIPKREWTTFRIKKGIGTALFNQMGTTLKDVINQISASDHSKFYDRFK